MTEKKKKESERKVLATRGVDSRRKLKPILPRAVTKHQLFVFKTAS